MKASYGYCQKPISTIKKANMKPPFFSILVYCVLLWGIGTIAYSAPVTVEQAEMAAKNFLVSRYPAAEPAKALSQTAMGRSALKIRDVAPLRRNDVLLGYVARLEPQGYILLTSDDLVPPVKLYSEDGSFENLPPGFKAVIETELLEDLTCLSLSAAKTALTDTPHRQQWNKLLGLQGNSQSLSEPSGLLEGVPLLTTAWHQNWPYNYYCPYAAGGPGGRAYAGCNATALAQILRHHRQPVRVLEDYTYTDEWGSCTGTVSISDAGMGDYDWANMPASISDSSPEAQKQAVGQLLYHCAVALPSDFEADGTVSGAEHPYVLWTYFGYRSCGSTEYRYDYSNSVWYSKIASDIDANRPISYQLYGTTIGHVVVCDGYRNGNEIHLDLGWSGAGTAWYNMDSVISVGRYTWTDHSAVFGITPSSISPPMIIYVNASATGANNGSSWADAYTSLQSALSAALTGDEIWVAKGTYKPTTDADRTISFVLKQCIAIYGGFAGTEASRDQRDWVANPTILSGDIGALRDNSDNSYHVLYGTLIGSTLDGFTITGGNASGQYDNRGGGMVTWGWGTISNCTFIGNLASDSGGGLAFSDSIVINCVFIGNSATYGGGICNNSGGWISNCSFSGNKADYGGAMYCHYYNYWDYLALVNCILWNNTSADGGEITLSNSTTINITYCDLKGGLSAVHDYDGTSTMNWGPGNIDLDPCFVSLGYWNPNGTPDDENDDFWVGGDYHLKSEAGRWDPNAYKSAEFTGDEFVDFEDFAFFAGSWGQSGAQLPADLDEDGVVAMADLTIFAEKFLTDGRGGGWVIDEVTSRCIDAGNPGSELSDEPESEYNLRIDMGSYGGTAEASRTPADWSLLADLTNDGVVNLEDFADQAADWLKAEDEQSGDLNRDGTIDTSDLAIFTDDWLKQTSWVQP